MPQASTVNIRGPRKGQLTRPALKAALKEAGAACHGYVAGGALFAHFDPRYIGSPSPDGRCVVLNQRSLDAAYDLVQEIGHIDNIDIKYLELSESFRTNTAVKDFVRGPRSHSTQSQQQVLATKRRKFFLVLLHFKLEYEPRF